jgi:hypothetical protein
LGYARTRGERVRITVLDCLANFFSGLSLGRQNSYDLAVPVRIIHPHLIICHGTAWPRQARLNSVDEETDSEEFSISTVELRGPRPHRGCEKECRGLRVIAHPQFVHLR